MAKRRWWAEAVAHSVRTAVVAVVSLLVARMFQLPESVVMLIPRAALEGLVAYHRTAEVWIGIGVALAFAIVWPEQDMASRR